MKYEIPIFYLGFFSVFLSYLVSVRPTFPDEVRNMTFFTTVFILLTILLGGVVHIARFG